MAEKKKADSKPADATVKKPQLKRSKKTLLLIGLWVTVLVVVGVISFAASRNNALASNKIAEQALEALEHDDDQTVYGLGSKDFKKVSDQTKVKAVVNQWSKVIAQATDGTPELMSKQLEVKDNKELTTLVYKYDVQPGKSNIEQKELFVRVVLEKNGPNYQLYTFNIDTKKKDSK